MLYYNVIPGAEGEQALLHVIAASELAAPPPLPYIAAARAMHAEARQAPYVWETQSA